MLRTITIGSGVSVQGMFIQNVSDGRITVKVGEKIFVGNPVPQSTDAPQNQQG